MVDLFKSEGPSKVSAFERMFVLHIVAIIWRPASKLRRRKEE